MNTLNLKMDDAMRLQEIIEEDFGGFLVIHRQGKDPKNDLFQDVEQLECLRDALQILLDELAE